MPLTNPLPPRNLSLHLKRLLVHARLVLLDEPQIRQEALSCMLLLRALTKTSGPKREVESLNQGMGASQSLKD
jgi:hypothetical protein